MASIAYSVTPEKITLGESAILRWDIEGVREIYLNGQGVTGHESRTVTPAATMTYHLHILLVDGTTQNFALTVEVENGFVVQGEVTRSPTVVLTPENIEQLKTYPRPPLDNGRGLHFHLDLRDESIATSVARLQYINATWTLIYAPDELQAYRAAKACWAVGILPVVRIGKRVDEFFDPVPYVEALKAAGAPPYVQIYNEPGDGREWEPHRPDDYVKQFARRWAQHAIAVYDAGGYPGLQVMGKSELWGAIDAVAATGKTHIWQRAFFVQHNYGVNHPPAFPYDARNQQDNPGQTVMDNAVAVLASLAFAHWMQEKLGFVLPIVGGEGGWQHGVFNDPRYPKVEQPYHAQYHREIFDCFRTGVLSNGEALPDYLFSVTPWILGGWHTSEDWWGGPLGTHTETIEAVRRIPLFARRFSWHESSEGGGAPVDPPPVDPPPVDPPPVDPPPVDPPPVDPPPVEPPPVTLEWDARLDTLGVRVKRTETSPAWRLIKALYRDHTESGNRHHVDVMALNPDGTPAQGIKFVVDWVGRQSHEQPGFPVTDGSGKGNYPIYNNMHPEKKNGTNFAALIDAPGDRVDGMGLPNNHHVCYELTFRFGP